MNNLLLNFYRHLRDKILFYKRRPYIKLIKEKLGTDFSIISSNCFAGRIMQDLKMEYNSPTLGLWIMPDDFPKFCGSLKSYLESELIECDHSKNSLGEYKRTHKLKTPYPVGKLGHDVEIHFLHYTSFIEAKSKFKRRSQRVNLNKIIFIAFEQNGCVEDDFKR